MFVARELGANDRFQAGKDDRMTKRVSRKSRGIQPGLPLEAGKDDRANGRCELAPEEVAEARTNRGLDNYGVPAPLLHAVGKGLKEQGLSVYLKSGKSKADWTPVANSDAFFGWVNKPRMSEGFAIQVRGPGAQSFCDELATLLDQDDPAIVVRSGFAPYTPEKDRCRSDPYLIGELCAERFSRFVFWLMADKRNRRSHWRRCADLDEIDLDDLPAGKSQAYVQGAETLARLDELLNRPMPDIAKLTMTIPNSLGVHARPAAGFVRTAEKYASQVTVVKDGEAVNGKSIMGIMMLVAGQGSRITICCQGKDAREALAALKTLVDQRFNEE